MTGAAPFHAEVAGGPAPDHCLWLRAADGLRLRVAVWAQGARGTVLLFPGRTEYVEKYAGAAAELAARGFACVTIDWRGQGLADRILADRNVGHIGNFSLYQSDLKAILEGLNELSLPSPHYLLAHSMGGAIGLRALYEGLDVRAAVFTGPMWGIALTPVTRAAAWVLSSLATTIGLGHRYAPGTGPVTYVADAPFKDNVLTTDPEMFALMKAQVAAHPELALGGPSLGWLHAGLVECRALAARPAPAVPALVVRGANERIVDCAAIDRRMADWQGAESQVVGGAEHEVMMERPATRQHFFDDAAAFFAAHA